MVNHKNYNWGEFPDFNEFILNMYFANFQKLIFPWPKIKKTYIG